MSRAEFAAELVSLFKKELELCKVKPGEVVIAFTDTSFDPAYPAACVGAALELGAEAYEMVVPITIPLPRRSVMDAWKAADMVVGMTYLPWLYSDAHNEALAAGVRTLMVREPLEALRRMFPDKEVLARTSAGARRMEKAKNLRVTSPAGTDVVMDKTGRPGFFQTGITDRPGRFEHWPSGLVCCAPIEGSVEGTWVLDEGDISFNLQRYVESRVKITIHEGRAVKFEGGTDARLHEEYFASANDPNAYVVSHIGWGTDHRARWTAMAEGIGSASMDSESVYGNSQIAFGSNFATFLGGKNVTAFHIDLPCLNHSFYLDDELVLDGGTFVFEDMK